MFRKRKIKLLLFLIGAIAGVYLFLFSPFFQIKEVEGIPAERSKEYVGKNIFLLSPSRIREEWVSLPEVREVTVEKKLPSLIRITVEERKPVLSFRKDRKWWGVDEEGVVFPVSQPQNSPPLFWKKRNLKPGEKYPELEGTVKIYQEFLKNLPGWEVRSLEIKKGGVILRTTKGITIIFGLENIPSQIRRLKKIIKSLKPLSSIDLRFGEEIIVR